MKFLAILSLPLLLGAAESRHWQDFVNFKKTGGAPGLPDYSYAGYAMGGQDIPKATGKRFAVTEYGAVPDDDKCDRAGIIAAIAAAKAAGGGVVYFPKGRYLVAEQENIMESIRIDSPDIVLKGAGCGPGGTEIFMRHHYGTKTPQKMYAVEKLFYFCPPEEMFRAPGIARITADAPRETFVIEVDRTDQLKPGQYVMLTMRNPKANSLYLAGLEPWSIWTETINRGVRISGERHQIDRIEGNKVFFKEPVHCQIVAEHEWYVRPNGMLPGWGVEDILFRGCQPGNFKHHLNYILDSGWSMIGMHRGINPYVRRCRFVDVSIAVSISSSYGATVMNCAIEGTQGHSSFAFDYLNYGGLAAFTIDNATTFHGWGANAGAVGSVIYRCKNSDRGFDWHASWPYATLIDNCTGGLVGNGGGFHVLPNHMQHLVLWNFHQTSGKPRYKYDFWQPRAGKERYSNVKVVKPYIIGYRGPWTFLESSCADVESYGKPVTPASLYLAQYNLRFGKLPPWHKEAEAQFAFYNNHGYFSPEQLTDK